MEAQQPQFCVVRGRGILGYVGQLGLAEFVTPGSVTEPVSKNKVEKERKKKKKKKEEEEEDEDRLPCADIPNNGLKHTEW
jgi:hypothetical protein